MTKHRGLALVTVGVAVLVLVAFVAGQTRGPDRVVATDAETTPTATATPEPTASGLCANGVAVPNPQNNIPLVEDCNALLALRDELRGTATLNWSENIAISQWTGVRVSSGRVWIVNLKRKGLNGVIPVGFGNLTEMRELRLDRNSLTGTIPADLGNIPTLFWLYVGGGNQLRGCIPVEVQALTLVGGDRHRLELDNCTIPAPTVIVISDGSHDELLLEWESDVDNATKWQYRKRAWREGLPLAWSVWTDIPSSDSETRSHAVTGLDASQGYGFQVRGARQRTGDPKTVFGLASDPAQGATQYSDGRKASLISGMTVEGDGVTEWRLGFFDWVFVIPDGMRITGGDSWSTAGHKVYRSDGSLTIAYAVMIVYDAASGSSLVMGSDLGDELQRTIVSEDNGGAGGASGQDDTTTERNVGSLFDQIVESVRENYE